MAKPTLLLLDEPMSGIHPRLAPRIATFLEELRTEGLTMLLVEHELTLVEQRAASALEISDWAHVLVSGTTKLSGAAVTC